MANDNLPKYNYQNKIQGLEIKEIKKLTIEDYNALPEKNPRILYVIIQDFVTPD